MSTTARRIVSNQGWERHRTRPIPIIEKLSTGEVEVPSGDSGKEICERLEKGARDEPVRDEK